MKIRDKPILVLFFTLFIVMVGFGIILPVMAYYAENLGASSLHLGLLMASYSVVQFIFAPYWGSISEKKGRKPILIIGLFGYGVDMIIYGLSTQLWMLFAARIAGGILSSATLPTAFAYIGDTTSEKQRGGGMGAMGAAMGLGMILGPAIGGGLSTISIVKAYDTPFFVAGIMALITMIFAAKFLRESHQRATSTAKESHLAPLLKALRSPRQVVFLFFVAFLIAFGVGNLEATFAFYSEHKFGYGAVYLGVVFFIFGIIGVVIQGLFIGRLINRVGEIRLIQLGLLIMTAGYILIIYAFDGLTLLGSISIAGVGSAFIRPSIPSLITKKTSIHGLSMGAQTSFDSLGRVAGPIWGGFIYLFNLDYPYITAAATFVFGLLTSFIIFSKKS